MRSISFKINRISNKDRYKLFPFCWQLIQYQNPSTMWRFIPPVLLPSYFGGYIHSFQIGISILVIKVSIRIKCKRYFCSRIRIMNKMVAMLFIKNCLSRLGILTIFQFWCPHIIKLKIMLSPSIRATLHQKGRII